MPPIPPISPVFTTIPPSDVDPDSPVTTNLMVAVSDNPEFLSQWLGVRTSSTVPHHRHKGTSDATDGTEQIAYSSITGAPSPSALLSFVNSQDVTVTWSGGVDGEFDTGALGLTPVGAEITIKSGSSSTNFFNWAVAKGVSSGQSYFIGFDAATMGVQSGTTQVATAKGFGSQVYATISQFSSAGIKITLPRDPAVINGQDIAYKVMIVVYGT